MRLPDDSGGANPLNDELNDSNRQNLDSQAHSRRHITRPPLLSGISLEESRLFYETKLCRGPAVISAIGPLVYFNPDSFGHAFFKSSEGCHKDEFDPDRAERLPWIRTILTDPKAEVRLGYLKKLDLYSPHRRTFFWPDERYIVVIEIHKQKPDRARFVTAFALTGRNAEAAARKILASPRP